MGTPWRGFWTEEEQDGTSALMGSLRLLSSKVTHEREGWKVLCGSGLHSFQLLGPPGQWLSNRFEYYLTMRSTKLHVLHSVTQMYIDTTRENETQALWNTILSNIYFLNDIKKWILVRTHEIDRGLGWDHSLWTIAPKSTCHDNNRSWWIPLEKGTGWLCAWGAGIFKFIVSPFVTFIFVSCASIYSINTSYFESFWQRAYFLIPTRMALKNQSLGPVKVSYQWIYFAQIH